MSEGIILYFVGLLIGGIIWFVRLEGVVNNLKEQLDQEKADRKEITQRLAKEIDSGTSENKKYYREIMDAILSIKVDIAKLQTKVENN